MFEISLTNKNHIGSYVALIALCAISLCLFSIDASAHDAYSSVVLDSAFRTPAPPNGIFQQNPEHVFNATTAMFFIAICFMVIAARDSFKYKSTVPLAMVLGAAFCVVPEAIDNYIAGCYWSQSHDPDKLLLFLMGREFDYYVGIMWWAFGAILGYLLYAVLLRKVTTGTLWVCLALSGIADIVLEEILLGYGGIYTYFGHQPLVLINNFPWWWLFANVSSLFLSVAIAYRFRSWFNGWKSIFILLLMPFCYIGAFTLAGMPAIFAIQGDFSPLTTEALGVATCVISVIQIGAIMKLVLGLNPFHLKGSCI